MVRVDKAVARVARQETFIVGEIKRLKPESLD
jgi:hypothetical protein